MEGYIRNEIDDYIDTTLKDIILQYPLDTCTNNKFKDLASHLGMQDTDLVYTFEINKNDKEKDINNFKDYFSSCISNLFRKQQPDLKLIYTFSWLDNTFNIDIHSYDETLDNKLAINQLQNCKLLLFIKQSIYRILSIREELLKPERINAMPELLRNLLFYNDGDKICPYDESLDNTISYIDRTSMILLISIAILKHTNEYKNFNLNRGLFRGTLLNKQSANTKACDTVRNDTKLYNSLLLHYIYETLVLSVHTQPYNNIFKWTLYTILGMLYLNGDMNYLSAGNLYDNTSLHHNVVLASTLNKNNIRFDGNCYLYSYFMRFLVDDSLVISIDPSYRWLYYEFNKCRYGYELDVQTFERLCSMTIPLIVPYYDKLGSGGYVETYKNFTCNTAEKYASYIDNTYNGDVLNLASTGLNLTNLIYNNNTSFCNFLNTPLQIEKDRTCNSFIIDGGSMLYTKNTVIVDNKHARDNFSIYNYNIESILCTHAMIMYKLGINLNKLSNLILNSNASFKDILDIIKNYLKNNNLNNFIFILHDILTYATVYGIVTNDNMIDNIIGKDLFNTKLRLFNSFKDSLTVSERDELNLFTLYEQWNINNVETTNENLNKLKERLNIIKTKYCTYLDKLIIYGYKLFVDLGIQHVWIHSDINEKNILWHTLLEFFNVTTNRSYMYYLGTCHLIPITHHKLLYTDELKQFKANNISAPLMGVMKEFIPAIAQQIQTHGGNINSEVLIFKFLQCTIILTVIILMVIYIYNNWQSITLCKNKLITTLF